MHARTVRLCAAALSFLTLVPAPEQNRVAKARPRTQPANSIRIAGPSNLCAAFCLFTA